LRDKQTERYRDELSDLVVLAIQQPQHAKQRFDVGDRIVSADELLTEISARHPSRDTDDLVIDQELEARPLRVLDQPHDPPLPAKQGVQRVFYSGLPMVAGIENITLANPATPKLRLDEASTRLGISALHGVMR
jgi:hypothetical protein